MKKQKIKDNVKKILSKDEESRNCDERLFQMYLWEFCRDQLVVMHNEPTNSKKAFIPLAALKTLPKFNSILRCRQLFQAAGFHLPTNPVIAKLRFKNEEDWRLFCANSKTYHN